MKRSTRTELAKQTVEIVERGSYTTADGRVVDLASAVSACLTATRFYAPVDLARVRDDVLARPAVGFATAFEVVNETTLAGIARVLADGRGPVAALNFASAKNPGGGFLNGSQAQEESLARSSALYASLQRAWTFYERHRASPSLLYSDAMILSPGCPVFRDDNGSLLERPHAATFITSVAPNAGAAADNRPEETPLIPDVLHRRADLVLALAASGGYKRLVLGAWGCGVFRNDPRVVATVFADHLRRGNWAGRFERVVFSVLDTSAASETYAAFELAMK
ncbi:TIGR02452 family protein [Limnoglobus roseus]|uniref:TIGR02452 family protein n=1 Tax=Limnoglobus roseus TaxID=2598579 RepID=A0A5C1A273_9BACT|nr:TIGR02452 family protein [Limnoglobus roseus]QEL13241.1 TIGR02452 family protein [Limnoglobus roseus]